MKASVDGDMVKVTVKVTNSGKREGKDAVLVYA